MIIDPQKIPYIGVYDNEYHIYNKSDGGPGRCGAKAPTYDSMNNRSWRPSLSHLIRMAGHAAIADRIYGESSERPHALPETPICKGCLATAQSPDPMWHKVLSMSFEKPRGALISQGHDLRLIKMPKGTLIGWVEHITKPIFIDRQAETVSSSSSSIRGRHGRMWGSSGYTKPAFKGWTKTKVVETGMMVSNDKQDILLRELAERVANTTEDEAHMYVYSCEDILFLADYTAGKYTFAGGWTFNEPDFDVKEMVYDEFIECGWWSPISDEEAIGGEKICPGCNKVCGLESVSMTTVKFHRCIYCRWNTIQPQKFTLIPKEEGG